MQSEGFRAVTGYWLGDEARFGNPSGSPPVVSGSLGPVAVVHRGEVEGVSVAVTHHGVVLADFSRWEVEAKPSPDGLLDRSPFADDRDRAERMFLLGRRVVALNAHQTCLLAALGIWSDDDPYAPDPRPVSAATVWIGGSEADVGAPTADFGEYLQAVDPSPNMSLLAPPAYPLTFLDDALTRFGAVLRTGPVALQGSSLLHAAWHYEAHRFDQALLCAFPAAETVLRELWYRQIEHRAEALAEEGGDYVLTSERRGRLRLPDFNSEVVLESLALAGVVPDPVYRKALRARRARNRLTHQVDPPAGTDAADAIDVAVFSLSALVGADVDLPYGITSHGV